MDMKMFLKIVFGCFSIYFFLWFILYKNGTNTLPIQSEDTVSTIFTTITMIEDKTLYLDKYHSMLLQRYPNPDDKSYEKGLVPFYLKKVNGHYLTAFPIITSIISIPVFYLPVKLGMPIIWDNLIILSHISSALIMSLSVWFFYLLLKNRFKLKESSLNTLTLLYAFGNINFAMFSQSLWQYGSLQLFLILGIYFSYSTNLFWSGFFSGISFFTRPTSLLPIMFNPFINIKESLSKKDGLFSLKQFKRMLMFVFGMIPPMLFFFWYDKAFYTDISNQGYAAQMFKSWLSPFPEGFLGIWISPSKGILVYSPVFIFSLVGLWMSVKKWASGIKRDFFSEHSVFVMFGIIVLLHIFVMGFWKHWFGGYSFGYRMAGDVIPFLVLLLIPFLSSDLFKRKVYRNTFYVLAVISVLVQICGMIFFDGIWHAVYDLGYKDTSWLWSVKDSEFMFNIRRTMVKFHMLDKACPKCL